MNFKKYEATTRIEKELPVKKDTTPTGRKRKSSDSEVDEATADAYAASLSSIMDIFSADATILKDQNDENDVDLLLGKVAL